jgi:hypothetical protein
MGMGEAQSYQSPSMQPPDLPDVAVDGQGNDLICSTSLCGRWAVEQDHFDTELCEEHLKDELDWDRADDQNKSDREEYGQYETDRSTG